MPRHIGPATPVTPFKVPGDEEKARALFIQWRYNDNGGAPYCPRCKGEVLYEYRCRDEFKCKKCEKRFSPTSGTRWAYSKLDYRDLLYLVATFCHEPDAVSANKLHEDMGRSYATVFLWLHKFRDEITSFMAGAKLDNEVEIDGGYFGGTIRPKNVKKERTDLRKISFRDPDLEMAITVAVERGGAVRTWVVKQEGHPRRQIDEAATKTAVLFTDGAASWNAFRGRRRLLQVNHRVAFMTPEACTNAAESAIHSLRVAEDVHRHIARNYLDLYAGEVGWRITYNESRGRKTERFETLMAMMAAPGSPRLAGYFEGKRRLCNIIDENGEPATWRPPTREERNKKRLARGKAAHVGPYRPRRNPSNWHEGFQFERASNFPDNWVRDVPGVYVVCLPIGSIPFSDLGYDPHAHPPMWTREGFEHVYTGETYGLKTRFGDHVSGSIEKSTFRETLLALQWHQRLLSGADAPFPDRSSAEDALTNWLTSNAVVGFKQSAHVRDYERDILSFTASPLNIARAAPTNFSRWLFSLRRSFRQNVSSNWEPPAPHRAGQPRR